MKKIVYYFLSFLFLSLLLSACSSVEETAKEEEEKPDPDVYVFDAPEDADAYFTDVPVSEPALNIKYYLVQIGAFTTKEKAEKFSEESKPKLNKELQITYSDDVNLFVVQLAPVFTDRKEAEKVRNALWKTKDFKDAWILTVTK